VTNLYTIIDDDGVVLASRVTRDEIYHLRGLRRDSETGLIEAGFSRAGSPLPVLVHAMRRRPYLWVSNVSGLIIKATLRSLRGLDTTPRSGSTRTGSWETISNSKGVVRVFTLNLATSFQYPTTLPCRTEHLTRVALRAA
jgi:hypothetical protein